MIEGSLDVVWQNRNEPIATPRYILIFCRSANFRNGPQQPKYIVGPDALERHLIAVGSPLEDAKDWVKKVTARGSVRIDNVMMPERYLAAYGQ